MNIFNKNLKNEILIIGEIGINHEGKLSEALKMLELASKSGLDAVKFQLYSLDKYQSKNNLKRYKRLKKFNLSDNDYKYLHKKAKKIGLKVIATPLTEDKVDLAGSFGEVVKVASGDIDFYPTIERIIKNKKKIILSTGNSNIKEIEKTVNHIKKNYRKKKISDYLALLHCVSLYPTPIEESNILKINYLKNRFKNLTIGYSNHCSDRNIVLSAVANGAKIIEIHITFDKKNKKFHDHFLSFDKTELKELINSIRSVERSIKKLKINPQKINKEMRKGIIASKNNKRKEIYSLQNLSFARPSKHYNSKDIKKLIGKKSTKNIKSGFLIN